MWIKIDVKGLQANDRCAKEIDWQIDELADRCKVEVAFTIFGWEWKSIEDMTTCMDASVYDARSNRLTNRQVYKSLDNWICKYFDKSWERLSQFLYVDQNTSACFFYYSMTLPP